MLNKLFKWAQGRSTAFCLAFFASGTVLQIYGKLTYVYVAFTATVLSAVIGHSIKEDWFGLKPPTEETKPAADQPVETK